jgi:uncharacterized protein
MARIEIQEAALAEGPASGETFFRLAMMYATGRTVEPDLVTAHKWFNISAAKGHSGAARYRSEIAREMTAAQIAKAQRAAREWLSVTMH